MRYISRSSHEVFSDCPRKGFYSYLIGGTGLQPTTTNINLALGLTVHKGMEVLFTSGGDVDRAIEAAWKEGSKYLDVLKKEDLILAEGLIRGWYRCRWDVTNEEFEILSIEAEVEALLSPDLTLQARADMVVRRRVDGTVWVWNWKTTSDRSNWTHQWQHDVQMWTEALALESHLKEEVKGCIVEGLYKGSVYNKESTSRLIFGYKDVGKGTYSTASGGGRVKFKAWEESFPFGRGLEGWIQWLPWDDLESQFPRSEPIMKNNMVVEKWIRQLVREEMDIKHMMETGSPEDKEDYFIQRFGKRCNWCSFANLCFLRSEPETLIADGFLKEREDHHKKKEVVG